MGDDDEAEGQLPPVDDEGQDETTGGLGTSTQGTDTSDTDESDTGEGASPGSSEDPDSIYGGGVDPKSIYGGG